MKLDPLQLPKGDCQAAASQVDPRLQVPVNWCGWDEMQTVPFDPVLALETLHSEQHSAESQGAEHGQEPSDPQLGELLRAKTLRL